MITLTVNCPTAADALETLKALAALASPMEVSSHPAYASDTDVFATAPTPVAPAASVPPAAPAAPVAPVPPVTPLPVSVPTTTPPLYTLEQLGAACAPLLDAGKQQELVGLLKNFGVQALTQLSQERYGEFTTALRGMGAKI